jgi:hypothetical protein
MTINVLTSLEEAARILQDDTIEYACGLTTAGLYNILTGSNYLKAADFAAIGLTPNLNNADFILDSLIYNIVQGGECVDTIEVCSGGIIRGESGDIYVDFGTTGSEYFAVTDDAGNYLKNYIYFENGSGSEYIADTDIQIGCDVFNGSTNPSFYSDTTLNMTYIRPPKYDGNITAMSGIVIFNNKHATRSTFNTNGHAPVSVSSQGTAIRQGVVNSVAVGGGGLSLNRDSTAFMYKADIADSLWVKGNVRIDGELVCNDSATFVDDVIVGGDFETSNDIKQDVHTDDVSNPPTDAELDAIFGTPATVGAGYRALIDDNGGGANFYEVVSDGTNWWIFTGTKAL